jgi:high-affinity iron transporter
MTEIANNEKPKTGTPVKGKAETNKAVYLWVAVALAVAVAAVILGWHSSGGTPDPSDPATRHMSNTSAVINSAILVFREGLETILVLAAITASFRGGNAVYRKPVAIGGAVALMAGVATWFAAVGIIDLLGGSGLTLQAATGIPAIIVLLIVMNWFFHKVYWTGWISHHHKRRKNLVNGSEDESKNLRRALLGFALLGFSSVYREAFEIVIFLQALRVTYGDSVVLEGVVLGLLFTSAVGFMTFRLHAKLPYKKLLIVTGALLLVVLIVMVGEEINEMQLAGWIPTHTFANLPAWLGEWFSIFGNWETVIAQVLAIAVVVGSYYGAEYYRVVRPRKRGLAAAAKAEAAPEQPATIATGPGGELGARVATGI